MIDTVSLENQTNRIMNTMFQLIGDTNITLYNYKERDFPYLKTLTQGIADTFNSVQNNYKAKTITYAKTYDKTSAIIVFSLLLNNEMRNTVTYTYEAFANLANTSAKATCFHVTMDIHYTYYHEYINSILGFIQTYLKNRYSNRTKIDGIPLT